MQTTITSSQSVAHKARPVDRSRSILAYTSLITLAGLTAVAYSLKHLPVDRTGLLIFVVLAVIAEFTSTERFIHSHSRISVSSIVVVASILALGTSAGILTYVASGLATGITTSLEKVDKKQKRASLFRRISFNTGMWAVTALVAGSAYALAGGIPGSMLRLQTIPALSLLAIVEWLVNALILMGVISLQTGQSLADLWKRDYAWEAPVSLLGGIIGGSILALTYETTGILGILVFLLPILAIGYSFRIYKNNMKEYVDNLETLNQELQDVNIDLLHTLSGVIDAYDMYTYGHSRQVAMYSQAIAEKLGLPQDFQAMLMKAALVHDIGKVGINDSIISKEGRLTDQEYKIIKRHTIIGAEIVGRMKGLKDLVPLIRSHHERWDGRGYPDGLVKEEIPLGARILAVADTLDVIISDRPYRSTRSFREAREEMVRCSGLQFDPSVVDALMAVAEDKGPSFFRNSAATVDNAQPMRDASATIPRFLKKSMTSN